MRSFVVTLGLIGSLMLGACSSSSESPSVRTTANGATASANSDSTQIASNGSNSTVVTNGMVVQQQPTDATSVEPGSPMDVIPMPQQEKLKGKLAQMQTASGERVDPRELAMKNARPAPDNSTFTSYLGEAGYEVRTFINHPQLQKVEKKTDSTGRQSLKIFLRNGNVIEVSPKSIPTLATAPAATIIAAAGLTPAPAKQPAASGTGEKKAVN